MPDIVGVPTEFKFASEGEPGSFEGYGAVNHLLDSHGDVIMPGAFAKSLAEHKAAGTMPALFVEHSAFLGGDPLPVGVWTSMEEDAKGLHVKGKLSALDTDYGKRLRSLMADGALKGLSIAFKVPAGGAVIGKKSGEPKRTLHHIDLRAVDIVRDPSNSAARVDHIRSVLATPEHPAVKAIIAAAALHRSAMAGGDSPTKAERDAMHQHLQDAHMALTGHPIATKSAPSTIREFETYLREAMGISHSLARDIAAHGFKASLPRDEGSDTAAVSATKAVRDELGTSLAGFSLPSFR
jgi:HK97 family phage prohead protease